LIELKNIIKSFARIVAVEDVSFKVEKGEHLAILGPSGCGKTTLLRLIAGLEVPDSGEILIDGKVVSTPYRMVAPNKRKIGMVFQDLALWPHMKVRENIGFGLESQGLSKRQREAKIKEVLSLVSLTRHIDCYPSSLSGGEQQRVALARALVLEPKILLMDEPLSDLDLRLKEELQKVIVKLQQRLRVTTIYVTHNQEEAFSMADRIVVMSKGKIEQIGTTEDLYNNPQTDFVKRFMRPK
jgi:ABC-type sugar transport system ATPase subunit